MVVNLFIGMALFPPTRRHEKRLKRDWEAEEESKLKKRRIFPSSEVTRFMGISILSAFSFESSSKGMDIDYPSNLSMLESKMGQNPNCTFDSKSEWPAAPAAAAAAAVAGAAAAPVVGSVVQRRSCLKKKVNAESSGEVPRETSVGPFSVSSDRRKAGIRWWPLVNMASYEGALPPAFSVVFESIESLCFQEKDFQREKRFFARRKKFLAEKARREI